MYIRPQEHMHAKTGVSGLSPGSNLLTVFLSPSALFHIPERVSMISLPP